MKKLQDFYLYSYRAIGFIFLSSLIASIVWYGFSILFFMGNSSWSFPLILSPNQEKVMAHLEHVLAFEHEITKNKAEIIAAEQILGHKKKLLAVNEQLLERINQSMAHQSEQYLKASKVFKRLNKDKTKNINHLNELTAEINNKEKDIDQELKLGLITKQEALIAHITWSKLYSNLVDSKASAYDYKRRSVEYADAAETLSGSGNDLRLMNRVIKKIELESHISQLKSDNFTLEISTAHLKKNVEKKSRVLSLMKNSPYILATKKSVTVAFVPYSHLRNVKVGAPIYSCFLDMVFCYKSGRVLSIYNAEEYTKHPIFKSDIKGQLIGIQFDSETDGQKKLLFLNSKPLLI